MSEQPPTESWSSEFSTWWYEHVERPVYDPIIDFMLPFNDWMNSLPPIVWHLSAVGLFALSGLATWFVPRRYIFAGSPGEERWRDLRIWAVAALVPYMAIYFFL